MAKMLTSLQMIVWFRRHWHGVPAFYFKTCRGGFNKATNQILSWGFALGARMNDPSFDVLTNPFRMNVAVSGIVAGDIRVRLRNEHKSFQ